MRQRAAVFIAAFGQRRIQVRSRIDDHVASVQRQLDGELIMMGVAAVTDHPKPAAADRQVEPFGPD